MKKRYGSQVRLERPIHRALMHAMKESNRTLAQEVNWILFAYLTEHAKTIAKKSP